MTSSRNPSKHFKNGKKKKITKQNKNWKCSQNNHFFQKMWQFPRPPSPHKKGHVMEYSFFNFIFFICAKFCTKKWLFPTHANVAHLHLLAH